MHFLLPFHIKPVPMRPPNGTITTMPPLSNSKSVRASLKIMETVSTGIEKQPGTDKVSNGDEKPPGTDKFTNGIEKPPSTEKFTNGIERLPITEKISTGIERQGKTVTPAVETVMREPVLPKGQTQSGEATDATSKFKPQQQPSNIKQDTELDLNCTQKNNSDSTAGVRVPCKPEAPKVSTTGIDLPLNAPSKDPTAVPKMTKINTKTIPYNPAKTLNPEITSTGTTYSGPCLQDSRLSSIVKRCATSTGQAEYFNETSSSSCQGTNIDGISSTTPTKPSQKSSYCKKCLVYFPNAKIYTQHKIRTHQKFVCKYCDKRFEELAFLKQHKIAVHYKPKVALNQERIANSNNKQSELIAVRKDIFASQSNQSYQQGFAQNVNHVVDKHGGYLSNSSSTIPEKVNSCLKCRKTFKHVKHLKQHMHSHQDNKPTTSTNTTNTVLCHFDMNGNLVVKPVT
ncbi:unnamed protein product [Allacma fusca]|uniref:C2H2-type domain-containing protein n=1 Tax=Allacma fusca TaxID=39272 RepID=A0A8J2P0G5_9HEXA|nr:unnamed protein product [Allacma fusca]